LRLRRRAPTPSFWRCTRVAEDAVAEDPRHLPLLRRWLYAAKPQSWPKLLVPFLLGQAIGLGGARSASWIAFTAGLLFTVLFLLYVVFLNDWADRDVDALKRRMFPRGCSPKTIPDQILPAHHLLAAGVVAGGFALGLAIAAGFWLDRPWFGPLAAVGLGIFAAYTLPPLRLNYRGGGELLEMIGVGAVLPILHVYLQGGEFAPPGVWLLPGFVLLSLASAIASGLSDERSDRRGGKTTLVSTFGNRVARRVIEALVFAGAAAWLFLPTLPWWMAAPPAGIAFFEAGRLLGVSGSAVTDAFGAQRRYKSFLHHAIWRGGACAAMMLVWRNLL